MNNTLDKNKTLGRVNIKTVQVQTMKIGQIVGPAAAGSKTNLKLLKNRVARLERTVRHLELAQKHASAHVHRLEERAESAHHLALQTEHALQNLRTQLANLEHVVGPLPQNITDLQQTVASIQQNIASVEQSISTIQTELETGLIANSQMEASLTALVGKTATFTTSGGSVTGTVILVGTNAVELREANGDIVIIPFSQITTIS